MYGDGMPRGKSAGELADEYAGEIEAAAGEIESAFDQMIAKGDVEHIVTKAIAGSSTADRLRKLREAQALLRGLLDGR